MSSTLDRSETPVRPRRRPGAYLVPGSVFVIGALFRIGSILVSRGGVRGNYGYDPSVYYAAADSFVHGRMPYQDFVLLHPPGVMLVLSPFAALGTLTTDLTGYVTGNLAFALLGAVNAVLVYCIARRMGVSQSAAWLGGAFYAVWAGSVDSEVSSRLEPLGSAAFLCGILALSGGRPETSRRRAVLAGVALGFAFCVKIWWLAPLAIVAVRLWRRNEGKSRLRPFLAGAAGAVALVDGPFFLMAPRAMAHMVVLDQIGRSGGASLIARLVTLSTLPAATPHIRGLASAAASLAFVTIFVGICALAWRFAPARFAVALAVVHLAIILLAPSFFFAYLDFLAPPLAISVAAAAHASLRERSVRPAIAVFLAGAAAIQVVGALTQSAVVVTRFPTSELAAFRPEVKCVTSITPQPLIALDLLSRNLHNGCHQWVDSYGRTYGVDDIGVRARKDNPKWQRDLSRYLLTGQAMIIVRPDMAVGRTTTRMLAHNPRVTVIYQLRWHRSDRQLDTFTIYAVAPRHNGRRALPRTQGMATMIDPREGAHVASDA